MGQLQRVEEKSGPEPDGMTSGWGQSQLHHSPLWVHILWTLFDWAFEREIRVCWDEELYPLELGLVAKQKAPNNLELNTQGRIVSSKRK